MPQTYADIQTQVLCKCGCGEPTPLAKRTVRERGHVRGQPVPFLKGHHRAEGPLYVVDLETGCWEWQRSKSRDGYGHLSFRGQMVRAHRWLYEQERGPISDGLELDHLCRNVGCVNPAHLEAVTHGENVRRGAARKLSDDDVRTILSSDETNKALGARLGVSDVRVSQIRKRGW